MKAQREPLAQGGLAKKGMFRKRVALRSGQGSSVRVMLWVMGNTHTYTHKHTCSAYVRHM